MLPFPCDHVIRVSVAVVGSGATVLPFPCDHVVRVSVAFVVGSTRRCNQRGRVLVGVTIVVGYS